MRQCVLVQFPSDWMPTALSEAAVLVYISKSKPTSSAKHGALCSSCACEAGLVLCSHHIRRTWNEGIKFGPGCTVGSTLRMPVASSDRNCSVNHMMLKKRCG